MVTFGLLGSEIDPEHLRFHHYCTGIAFGPVRFESTAILSPARARHDSTQGGTAWTA